MEEDNGSRLNPNTSRVAEIHNGFGLIDWRRITEGILAYPANLVEILIERTIIRLAIAEPSFGTKSKSGE
jgi:hypothetical protein